MDRRKFLQFLGIGAGAVALSPLLNGCATIQSSLFPIKPLAMDTSNWKTYCVGRYLIDIPPQCQHSYA